MDNILKKIFGKWLGEMDLSIPVQAQGRACTRQLWCAGFSKQPPELGKC